MRHSYEMLPTVSLQTETSMIWFVKTQPVYQHFKNIQGKIISSYTKVTHKLSENKQNLKKILVLCWFGFQTNCFEEIAKIQVWPILASQCLCLAAIDDIKDRIDSYNSPQAILADLTCKSCASESHKNCEQKLCRTDYNQN